MPSTEAPTTTSPKITVVTPSYNQAEFLEQTIRSVLDQGYENLEYLVIDGGSDDGSRQVIERYADRLAHWVSEPDEGQSDAIAKGFARATGEILCWVNSDDVLLPGSLLAVADYFASHPEAETLSAGAYSIDADGEPLADWFGAYTLGVPAGYDRLRFYDQDGVFQMATFWRRSAYEAVGGLDRSLQFVMDRDLFTRLAKRRPFDTLPKFLACFRVHQAAKSTTIQPVRQAETQELLRRYGVDRHSPVVQKLMYYRYRVPSLSRKAWLGLLAASGAVRRGKVAA
ncbi:MAG: glycosyltransferase family 2 protein [Planctomycetota bacterium]